MERLKCAFVKVFSEIIPEVISLGVFSTNNFTDTGIIFLVNL
ncbi:hypothetical protein ADICYQ_0134 [Cyclobacterium qasimii M12-11B]|uniref:Uncharacterized protein n=1 Tax=Cyclobacterium qasimii M12-11B TaxID=641524 RepID=S7X6J2_9BACT|nr:hypothetical protein ADICYQ_0134 [Cyclobacterium qasimii M12-11B]